MSGRCKIKMWATTDETVMMWCETCTEVVANLMTWSPEQVRDTAEGHHRVSAKEAGRKWRKEHAQGL